MKNRKRQLHVGDKVEIRFQSGRWKGGFVIIQILPATSQAGGGDKWLNEFNDGWAYYVKNIGHGIPRDIIKPEYIGIKSRTS